MKDEGKESFVVRDRRVASSIAPNAQSEGGKADSKQPDSQRPESVQPLPEPDFSSFILSLAATAQVALGVIPNPDTNLVSRNLPQAKNIIDIIAMLKEKTKGNLAQDESALIDDLLYSLRMQYIKAAESKA